MTIDERFAPDAARGRLIDRRMHRELGLSLRHVFEQSRSVLEHDAVAAADLTQALVDGQGHPPGVFGRYYELVDAILDEDLGTARVAMADMLNARPSPPGLHVFEFGGEALGRDNALYGRMMNGDGSAQTGFMPPRPDVAASFRTRLAAGLALLDDALPALSGEIRAIIRQIVIAGNDPAKPYQFDGASHFQLWGVLFLNGNFHQTPIAVAEVLAHESAHSLLFGFCTDQALVENADEELFPSPLRHDPRPMDGIYHATYVSARMHWAMSQLARSGRLSEAERETAAAAAATDLVNFDAGHGVVAEHGRLTELGRNLMDAAKSYIDGAR